MKKRLIELLSKKIYPKEGVDPAEVVADYLLDNGVVVLPCAVGDTVYVIEPCSCYSRFYADSCKQHFDDDKRIKALLIVPRGRRGYRTYKSCFKLFERKFQLKHLDKIGKTVFLTKEEAEKALERSEWK